MKIKLFTASILVFLIFIGLGQTGNVQAADSLDDKKNNVEENLNNVEKDILNTAEKVNKMNEDIAVLEAAIAANDKEVENATNEVDKYDKEIKAIKKEIKVLEEEIEERNLILKERLSSYQNTGGDLGYLEVIFGSVGFEDFISRFTAVNTITKADNDLVEEQKKAIKKVEEKEEEVEVKLTEAKETKNKLTKINEVKKDQKADLVKSADSVKLEKSKLENQKTAYIKEGNDIKALEEKTKVKLVSEKEEAQKTEQVATEDTSNKSDEKVAKTKENTKSPSNQKTETPKKEKQASSNSSEPSSSSIKEFRMEATAYTAQCTGCSGITATGINLLADRNKKVVAVDPSVIPLGSRVWVSGYGEAIAGDTGGAIKGNRIDLHMATKSQTSSFGRRTVTVKVLN